MNIEEVDINVNKLYEIERRICRGAYGIVWKAINRKSKEVIALKKIFGAFRNQTDAQRTYREVMFLKEFDNHPNIVKLSKVHKATNNMDIYLVFEYVDADLEYFIRNGILKDKGKRFIMYQIIKALLYLHSGNVVHRDLKPSNILIDNRCCVKIADFGLARSLSSSHYMGDGFSVPPLTDYVASRWYRAPELLLGSKRYSHGVDMWSLGCVLGEMLAGKPLFPGLSTLEQLDLILSTIKPPTPSEIAKLFPSEVQNILSHAPKERCSLKSMLKNGPPDGIDLVSRLLVFHPYRRLICEEALYHPYVEKFEEKEPVPMLTYNVQPYVPDDIQLNVEGYRELLYKLIADQDGEPRKSRSGAYEREDYDQLYQEDSYISQQNARDRDFGGGPDQ